MFSWVISAISMVFGINRPKHIRDFRKASDTLTAAPVSPASKPLVDQALKLTKAGRRQASSTSISIFHKIVLNGTYYKILNRMLLPMQ